METTILIGYSLGGYTAACVAYWARETYWHKYALVGRNDECDRNIANHIITIASLATASAVHPLCPQVSKRLL
ncbi:MAG: hypothetical protein AAF572_12165 [Cyanobacteria bacterium P01_B01_bin.77]